MLKGRNGILVGLGGLLAGGAGAAFVLWMTPAKAVAAFLAIAAFAAAGFVLFAGERKEETAAARFGVYLGGWAIMAAGLWVYVIDTPVVWRVLLFNDRAIAVVLGSPWRLFMVAAPIAGVPVLGLLWLDTVKGFLKSLKGDRGRTRSESELFGKARFLERKWLRGLSKQKGLLLGDGPDGLVAYRLEGSAMTFAPPRTGKGATIALNYLSPEERGWQGSSVVIDPRGELYPIVARRRRSLGRRPILLDPFGMVARHRELEGGGADFGEGAVLHLPVWRSDTYNPLDFIREGDEAVRDIGVLVEALMERPKSDGGNSKHFYESARSLISGYLSWVRFKCRPTAGT